MAISVLITLTTAGTGTGPFDLYSDVDGYTTPFETNVSKAALEAGYYSGVVPDAATIIRVTSLSVDCPNYVDLAVPPLTTTTTSTTTSTTTAGPTTTSTTSTTTTTLEPTTTSTTSTTTTVEPTTTTSTTSTTTTLEPTTTSTTTSTTTACITPTLYLASTSNDACNQINGQFLIGISHTLSYVCPYCDWETLNSTVIPSLANGTYYVSDGTNVRAWTKTSTPSVLYDPTACSSCPITTTTTSTTTTTTTIACTFYYSNIYDDSCTLVYENVVVSPNITPTIGYYYRGSGLGDGTIVQFLSLTCDSAAYFTTVTEPGSFECPPA